jgi:hypothetical protein
MKRNLRFGMLCLWVVTATLGFSRLWLTHPDLIPRFPEPFWIWLIGIYGSQNGEELADLEMLVSLVVSFVAVLAFTYCGWLLLRRDKKMLTRRSIGPSP